MIIQTPTPNLKKSIDFYTRLKFDVNVESENAIVTDGQVTILINSERTARAGVNLFFENKDELIGKLKAENKFYGPSGNMLSEPSGMRITLLDISEKPEQSEKPNGPSLLGSYAGVSMETPDMEKSLNLWKTLGFEVSMGGVEQGWIALSNVYGHTISLMKPMSCPHLFFNPSLTFFNGANNLSIIEGIREAVIEITEEITHFNPQGIVDNIIIRDPGGYGFFIFSD